MRAFRFIAIIAVGFSLAGSFAGARPVDLSAPSGGLGAADARGFLEVWREVEGAGVEFGKGSYLPLRYQFSSETNKDGILGAGFYVPMFEGKNVLIRESTMLVNLPCGKKLYLWRSAADPTQFLSPDKEWFGKLDGDNFDVWRNDGWKLHYFQGKLLSLTTDENRVFTWTYNNDLPASLNENGKALVAVEPNNEGRVSAFIFGQKRYEVQYARRPLMQIVAGQAVVARLAEALTAFTYSDGKKDSFSFDLSDNNMPRLNMSSTEGESASYSWEAGGKHLLTEKSSQGEWTYTTAAVTQEFGEPSISRVNATGQIEGSALDNKAGIYTQQNVDGSKTVTHVFKTPGPLYGKIQKVERTQRVDGKEITTQIYKASYDEAGKIIREIDEKGWISTFKYDAKGQPAGRSVTLSNDPTFLAALAVKEKVLLTKVKATHNGLEATRDLYEFYISQLDYSKASAVEPMLENREAIYNLRLDLIATNPNLSTQEKDQKLALLSNEFPEYRVFTKGFLSGK